MRHLIERKQRGSASIEMAGATIVLALMLVFILQAGAMMVAQVAATNAAREGARAAAALPPGNPVQAASRTIEQFQREINVSGGGDSVTVQVRIKTPVMFQVVDGWDWWVSSKATMRRER